MRRCRYFAVVLLLSGCGVWETVPGPTPQAETAFDVPDRRTSFSDQQTLAAFDNNPEPIYRLGTGDRIFLDVAARTELSGEHRIGPDGRFTLPFAGSLEVAGLTREAAAPQSTPI